MDKNDQLRLLMSYYSQKVLIVDNGTLTTLDENSINYFSVAKNKMRLRSLSLLSDDEIIYIHERVFQCKYSYVKISRGDGLIHATAKTNTNIEYHLCINTGYGTINANLRFMPESDEEKLDNTKYNIGEISVSDSRPIPYTVIDYIRGRGYVLPFDRYTIKELVKLGVIEILDGSHIFEKFLDDVSNSTVIDRFGKRAIKHSRFNEGQRENHLERQARVKGLVAQLQHCARHDISYYHFNKNAWAGYNRFHTSLKIKQYTKMSRVYKILLRKLSRGEGIINDIHDMNLSGIEKHFKRHSHNGILIVPNDDSTPEDFVKKEFNNLFSKFYG